MRRVLSRFLFVVVLLADTILFLWSLRPTPHKPYLVYVLGAFFFNSYLFWRVTVPIVGGLGLTVLTEKIRGRPNAPRRSSCC